MAMNGKEYLQTQITIIEICRMVNKLPLEDFIKCIRNAEIMSPKLNPKMFKAAENNLKAMKDLSTRLLGIKIEFAHVESTIMKTATGFFGKEEAEKNPS